MNFSNRKRLSEKFFEWVQNNNEKFTVSITPLNVITWLETIGYLTEPTAEERGVDALQTTNSHIMPCSAFELDSEWCAVDEKYKCGAKPCLINRTA